MFLVLTLGTIKNIGKAAPCLTLPSPARPLLPPQIFNYSNKIANFETLTNQVNVLIRKYTQQNTR
jgi:hypothetical protein